MYDVTRAGAHYVGVAKVYNFMCAGAHIRYYMHLQTNGERERGRERVQQTYSFKTT